VALSLPGGTKRPETVLTSVADTSKKPKNGDEVADMARPI